MPALVFKRIFAVLIALNLIGGAMMQFAAPAYAAASSASAAGLDPCEQMGMAAENQQTDQSMPCNSMPCKGALGDCMQMCLAPSVPVALPTSFAVNPAAVSHYAASCWPVMPAHTGLSVKPDPFPPKLLIIG